MSFSVHGLAVSRGIAIGRAVIVASSRIDVAHYFVQAEQVEGEIERLRHARNEVSAEIVKVQQSLHELGPADAHPELTALEGLDGLHRGAQLLHGRDDGHPGTGRRPRL